jgi:hypothetical protein
MVETQQLGDEVRLAQYEYEDREVLAADFGPGRDASVDVLDGTVIVVVDGQQYELAVEDNPHAFIRNGVLTVEVVQ